MMRAYWLALLIRNDRAGHQLAQLAEDVLRRNPDVAARRGTLEDVLRGLLVEDARVDAAVVQLAERDQRRERGAAIASAERTRLQQREDERGDLVGEAGIGLAPEGRDLRALDGAHQSELRLDYSGMRLVATELRRHRAMQLDHILHAEIAHASVSL